MANSNRHHASLSRDVLFHVLSHLNDVTDVARAAMVCKVWHAAAMEERLWKHIVQSTWGCWVDPATITELQVAQPSTTAAAQRACQLTWHATHAVLHNLHGFQGFCEDFVTAIGRPYAMQLTAIRKDPTMDALREPHLVLHLHGRCKADEVEFQGEAQCHWSYTEPTPRTNVALFLLEPTLLEAALSCGHMRVRRVVFREYERQQGSGPVDVPTAYTGIAVGPVLMGTFLPEAIPPEAMGLSSTSHACGCWLLCSQHFHSTRADVAALRGTSPRACVCMHGVACSNLLLYGRLRSTRSEAVYSAARCYVQHFTHNGSQGRLGDDWGSAHFWLWICLCEASAAQDADASTDGALAVCVSARVRIAADGSVTPQHAAAHPSVHTSRFIRLLRESELRDDITAYIVAEVERRLFDYQDDGTETGSAAAAAAQAGDICWLSAPDGSASVVALQAQLQAAKLPHIDALRHTIVQHTQQGGSVAVLHNTELYGKYAGGVLAAMFVHGQAGRGCIAAFHHAHH